jgi:teichuronic acid exporter
VANVKNIFTRAKQSEFVRNWITVVSGSSIAQFIPIVAAPLLARIYSPSEYGVLGVYVGLSGIISIIATFQYHNAILIPKDKQEAEALVGICIRNTLLTSLFAATIVLLLRSWIADLINSPELGRWLYFLPLSVFCTGLNLTFSAYSNREKLFRLLSVNRVLGSLASVAVSLAFSYIMYGETGLLFGLFAGQIVNSFLLGIRVKSATQLSIKATFSNQRLVRKKYQNFPKFSLPTDLLNNLTNQFPVLIINTFAGQTTTGLFNMCNRLLSMPQIFVANSLGEVFRQRASHDFNHIGSFRNIYLKTITTLVGFSIIPFLILVTWGPDLFAFFLGQQWREAGSFARIMAPLFLLRFINSPISYSLYIVGKLRFDLTMTVYLNLSTIIILYFALANFSVSTALFLYVLNYCLTYLFMLYKSYHFSKILNIHHRAV